ncbi:MAG: helix-turn-helix domain-containing protein [Chloroflexi bacterium]|nr:helix-turn-helix domain-containing protein [Chloroflexota bacterium]
MATVLERESLTTREPLLARDSEIPAVRQLAAILTQGEPSLIRLLAPNGESMRLPDPLYSLLVRAVRELARGKAVTVVSVDSDLTTQQAADLLSVSRPFLIKLLESGAIPFHLVGTHRRIRLKDVLAYRERRSQERRAALAEMAREAQELGLYE